MVRIALISDTHLPRFGRALPRALVKGIRDADVDQILHAGDWTEPIAVDLLAALAPVDGVAGNNDGDDLRVRFGMRLLLDLDGVRIGITHGHLGMAARTRERAIETFAGTPLDVIAFGHSHRPWIEQLANGTWLLNPGSPTDKRTQARYTWIRLDIGADRALAPELVAYDDRSA